MFIQNQFGIIQNLQMSPIAQISFLLKTSYDSFLRSEIALSSINLHYLEIQLAVLEISKHYEQNFSCKKGDIPFNFQDGPWHRDTYNLNGPSNTDGSYDDSLVMKLKPFYYTCLIPLDDITEENGRTEFLVGSHHHTYNEAKGGLISEFFFYFCSNLQTEGVPWAQSR